MSNSFRFSLMNFSTSEKEGERSTLVPPFRGNTDIYIYIYITTTTITAQCKLQCAPMCLCTSVNGLVSKEKTPPVQVAGDDHHECKLCICAS